MQPYPQQQPYPPQYPAPVAYPPQAPPPPAGYPAQYPAQYPMGYGQPAPAAPPAQPTAPGSLDGYYGQPSTGGGKAWSFHNRPNGTTYVGVVARPITDNDIQQQTDVKSGQPRFFRDGRPMYVMIVPLRVPQSPEFPDGIATWWVRGQARDELVRAMTEAGVPTGANGAPVPPEAGAMVQVTKTGERQSGPGMNPSYQYRVVYTRPTGADPAQVAASLPTAASAAAVQYAPQPQYVPGMQGQPVQTMPQPYPPAQPVYSAPPAPAPVQYNPQVAQTTQPAYVPGMQGQPIPALNIGPTVTPPAGQYVPQGQPAPATNAAPNGLTPDQVALMATLTGSNG